MGVFVKLRAPDGHELAAYEATPSGEQKGRVVVAQEILGVNSHIRSVCDRFAEAGYRAVAPALYDRLERNVELTWANPTHRDKAYALYRALHPERVDDVMLDVTAAASYLGTPREVGVVGYCYGGLIAWLAACRLGVACASCYYGQIKGSYVEEQPTCPTICHFGERDESVSAAVPEGVIEKHPEVEVFIYPADHAFNNDDDPHYYNATAAALARERTLALFAKHLSG